MKYLIRILFCLSVLRIANSHCLEGCLKCNSRDECQFCDGTKKYILDVITCKKIELANCDTISTTGNCIVCAENFYIDQATLKCMEITSDTEVENCSIYASAGVCQVCQKDFFVKEGGCEAIPTPIPNCLKADSSELTRCDECDPGFLLALDKKTCNPLTKIDNCAGYSNLMCRTCRDDYVKENNIYIDQIYNFNTEAAKFVVLQSLLHDSNDFVDQGVYNVCKKKEVSNCVVFSRYNECKECKEGFVLTEDFKCRAYPHEEIANCTKYSSSTKCIECKEGMHLNGNACVSNEEISNCHKYARNSTTTTCIECSSDYFLRNNACRERTSNSIFDNCAETKLDEDICEKCNEGYQVTDDGMACLSAIANCLNYKESTNSTERHTCIKCVANYYYKESDQECVQGTVPNCNVYKDKEDECDVCDNKYYLNSDGDCIAHNTLDGCIEYSFTTDKTCTACDESSMLFAQVNTCLGKEEEIEYCVDYASPIACGSCIEGFEVDSSGNCIELTNPSNCLVKNNDNECTKCISDYYIDEEGTCTPIEDFFDFECESHNVDGTKSFLEYSCNYCSSGAIPFNFLGSYVCTKSDNIESTIEGCNKYYKETNEGTTIFKCGMCNNNQVVSISNECSEQCSGSEAQIVMQGFNTNSLGASTYDSYSISYNNICKTVSGGNFDNCSHMYPDLFNHSENNGEFTYSCAKCNGENAKVLKPETAVITNDPSANLYGRSPVESYPGVSCLSQQSIQIDSSSSLTSNCEYYYSLGDNNYGCYRCAFGYSGVVVSGGYIETCSELATCKTSTNNSSGLNTTKSSLMTLKTVWASIFSCFECINASQIPFAAVNFSDDSTFPKLEPFSLSVDGNAYNTGTGGHSVNCYSLNNTTFGISLSANFVFPANCAMGVIDTTKVPNAAETNIETPDPNKASVFCVSCKPGYRPLYVNNGVGLLMIYECEKISTSKCASSTWYNACSNCATGFMYKYNPSTKMVEFDRCEAFTDRNCYAVDITDTESPQCIYCKKGFTLNIDKKCERINTPRCNGNQFTLEQKYHAAFETDQHSIGMILAPNGAGCHRCESGFLALKEQEEKSYCTASSYVSEESYATSTNMIENCTNYYVDPDENLICKVCKESYILTTAHKCVLASEYPNCKIANTNSGCDECEEEYVNISNNCQLKDIDKCIKYNQGALVESQTCLQCEPEHFPSDGSCVKGDVAYCKILADRFECTECEEGFTLVTAKDAKSYCYPIDPSLNCKALSSQFTSKTVECLSCKQGYSLSTALSDRNATICMDVQLVPECVQYDFTKEIATSTFNCLKCNDDYYVDSPFSCKLRTIEHIRCIEYEELEDKCKICEEGYFVTSEGVCQEYPNGIKGCRTYSNITTCSGCVADAYLENNECIFIESDRLIENCLYYESESECAVCDSGYAVSEGKCAEAQAKGCLSYASPTRCETCPEDYGFQDESGIRNCIPKQVSRCVESEDFFPFRCIVCTTGFYSNNGTCMEVNNIVEGCSIYSSPDECSECQIGLILSADKKSCISDGTITNLLDPNCTISYISEINKCVKCNKGFILDEDNKCVECSENKLSSGCYVCNPENQSKCTLCAPGFYQTKDALCVANNSIDEGKDNSNNEDNDNVGGEEEEAVSILQVLASIYCLNLMLLY